jgi:predicted HNH restriction endonuclease
MKKEKSEEYKKYQKYIRSKEWKEIRDEVFEERNQRCQICGRREGEDKAKLSVHHNSYEHLYDERDHKEDLLVVCSVCHLAIHRNKNNYKRFKL